MSTFSDYDDTAHLADCTCRQRSLFDCAKSRAAADGKYGTCWTRCCTELQPTAAAASGPTGQRPFASPDLGSAAQMWHQGSHEDTDNPYSTTRPLGRQVGGEEASNGTAACPQALRSWPSTWLDAKCLECCESYYQSCQHACGRRPGSHHLAGSPQGRLYGNGVNVSVRTTLRSACPRCFATCSLEGRVHWSSNGLSSFCRVPCGQCYGGGNLDCALPAVPGRCRDLVAVQALRTVQFLCVQVLVLPSCSASSSHPVPFLAKPFVLGRLNDSLGFGDVLGGPPPRPVPHSVSGSFGSTACLPADSSWHVPTAESQQSRALLPRRRKANGRPGPTGRAPKTHIGGSGVSAYLWNGVLLVQSWFFDAPFQFHSAPKTHIGGSGVSACGGVFYCGSLDRVPAKGPFVAIPASACCDCLHPSCEGGAPKTHIGGSGVSARPSQTCKMSRCRSCSPHLSGSFRFSSPAPPTPSSEQFSGDYRSSWAPTGDGVHEWLLLLTSWVVPIARGFLLAVFLALLQPYRGLWHVLPTPATRILRRFPRIKTATVLLPFICASPASSQPCSTERPHRVRKTRTVHPRRSSLGLLAWFCQGLVAQFPLPGQPPAGAMAGVGALWILSPDMCLLAASMVPDELPESAMTADAPTDAAAIPASRPTEPRRSPDSVANGVASLANDYHAFDQHPRRGPPPPQPVHYEVDNTVQHTRPYVMQDSTFSVWIGAPHHLPVHLQLQLPMPCDVEDALDAVERRTRQLGFRYCNRAVAVRPQPFPCCAAMVMAPDWATYTSIATVCLDLRDLGEGQDGPVIACHVTRPTCLAELCREGSVRDHTRCAIYVGTDATPLAPDEQIHLANGCLVTFLRSDRRPFFANDLQYRLQFPEVWQQPPRFPAEPALRSSLLLLHSSGRYIFRPPATHDPGDVAAAQFVGIPRDSVDFHTPAQGLERVMYRGLRVRGVIALADRLHTPQFVVFLDLRQITEGVQFVVLDVPYILLRHLRNLVRTVPPPGWRLCVTGGRRRRDRIEVEDSAVPIFGFRYACDSDDSDTSFDPTTPDEEEEDEESEDTPDQSVAGSNATTRSRSRSRRSGGRASLPSSDRSYHGGFATDRHEPTTSPAHSCQRSAGS